jgi:hypothetical protein
MPIIRNESKVGALKKVELTFEVGTARESSDVTGGPREFSFIFGIGTEGLSPFEFYLSNKHTGEKVSLEMDPVDIPATFQHIAIPLPQIPGTIRLVYFTFEIKSVAAADNREIIGAMAQISECGSHCCNCR